MAVPHFNPLTPVGYDALYTQVGASSGVRPCTTLFIGSLSPATSEAELTELVSRCDMAVEIVFDSVL